MDGDEREMMMGGRDRYGRSARLVQLDGRQKPEDSQQATWDGVCRVCFHKAV